VSIRSWSGPLDKLAAVYSSLKLTNPFFKTLSKSMTIYTNSQQWQDVYHSAHHEAPLYVKVQIDTTEETVVIVSFKAR